MGRHTHTLGLHPELVGQYYHELELLISLIPDCKYVGEVGLDGSIQHKDSFSKQENVFGAILTAAANNGGRIFSMHSRNAATQILNCLHQNSSAGKFVLHWFTGTQKELLRAVSMGCFFLQLDLRWSIQKRVSSSSN